MTQEPHLIGLLIGNPAVRQQLADTLREADYSVLDPEPAAVQPENWANVSLVITDEAAAQTHRSTLQALKAQAQQAYLPLLIALPHNADGVTWLRSGVDDVLRLPMARAEIYARLDVFLKLRQQVQDKLRHTEEHLSGLAFQNRLKALHEVSVELAQVETTDALFHNAILLGRERLGFDRLGLFIVGKESSYLNGTYGTDPQGQLRDESGVWFTLDKNILLDETSGNRWNVIVRREVDLWDDDKIIGRGWNAMAMLWNDANPLGWLAADNLINQEPLKDERIELLGLYASMLGALLLKARTEEELRASRTALNSAQQVGHMGSWELDLTNLENLNANPLRWSDEVFRIFGYELGAIEVSNENFFKAVHPEDREAVSEAVSRSIQDKTQYSIEHRILRADGTEGVVHERSDIIYDSKTARPIKMVGIIQDITDRKFAEAALIQKNDELKAMTEQLWQAAKLATMGEFAASIAHELNNPLATINLRVESLLTQIPPEDPHRRPLEIVEQEAERMARLVANILQFSRRSTQQISTMDVCEEIKNTLELIESHLEQRQIETIDRCNPHLPMIPADRQQLRQLFLNLFANASDAMPTGGTLTIEADTVNGQTLITISDTGTGISPENLSKVLEPFFTTKVEGRGTGLGLAICRRIVQDHGGTLEIASEPGHGTTVKITLPHQTPGNGFGF